MPGDTNNRSDVFVRDRQSGVTERVSLDSGGAQGNDASGLCSISPEGRYVAFDSAAKLVPVDSGFLWDIFLRDRLNGTTELVSVDSAGVQADADSFSPSLSADGRYVVFQSFASNLVPGDTNEIFDVFVRDRLSATTERVSVDSAGAQGNNGSAGGSISADGRYVAFTSGASNLVPGDTNSWPDIFVRDRQLGTTTRVSVGSGGAQANRNSYGPSITPDGRFVAFSSEAPNLVPGDANRCALDVFVRDLQNGTTTRVSVDSSGAEGNSQSEYASISADAHYVAFHSSSRTLVFGDTNGYRDVFVHTYLKRLER